MTITPKAQHESRKAQLTLMLAALLCLGTVNAADDVAVTSQADLPHQTAETPDTFSRFFLLPDDAKSQSKEYQLGETVNIEMNLSQQDREESALSSFHSTAVWNFWNSLSLKAGVGLEASNNIDGSKPSALADWCESVNCLEDQPDSSLSNSYLIGARWQPTERVAFNVDVMNKRYNSLNRYQHLVPISSLGGTFNTLTTNGEILDLSLSCEIDTGNWGDWRLGLQVSSIDDPQLAAFNPAFANSIDAASIGLGWQYGSFSTDIIGRYTASPAQFDQATAHNSLDINFSWRTPWNGQLMFGASNVANESLAEDELVGSQITDQDLGRIPYIRYRQDL